MATRSSRRGAAKKPPYDLNDPNNWTIARLKNELQKCGIRISQNLPKPALKQLYLDNVINNVRTIGATASQSQPQVNQLDDDPDRVPGSLPPRQGVDLDAAQPRNIFELSNTAFTTANLGRNSVNNGNLLASPNNIPAVDSATCSVSRSDTTQGQAASGFNIPAQPNDNNLVGQNSSGSLTTTTTTTAVSPQDTWLPTLQLLQQTVGGLQQTMASMLAQKQNTSSAGFTLQSVYDQRLTSTTAPLPMSQLPTMSTGNVSQLTQPLRTFGVSPEQLPFMDLLSTSMRKQIIEGKDVNLASLLIPYYDVPDASLSDCKHDKVPDARLKRPLSISEFITAFGRYKRTMCQVYPDRRDELDQYEAYIVSIHNTYGTRFYEYHKLFSLRAASALSSHGLKVDWSKSDRDLLQKITAGAKASYCMHCGEVSHDSGFCHLAPHERYTFNSKSSDSTQPNSDRYGRKKLFHAGTEVCNNFNSIRGCIRGQKCYFSHVCQRCSAVDHGAYTCRQLQGGPSSSAAYARQAATAPNQPSASHTRQAPSASMPHSHPATLKLPSKPTN